MASSLRGVTGQWFARLNARKISFQVLSIEYSRAEMDFVLGAGEWFRTRFGTWVVSEELGVYPVSVAWCKL